jgi:hypothetical protein
VRERERERDRYHFANGELAQKTREKMGKHTGTGRPIPYMESPTKCKPQEKINQQSWS